MEKSGPNAKADALHPLKRLHSKSLQQQLVLS